MVKASRKKGKFRDMIGADVAAERVRTSTYGYLKLPKGVNMYKEPQQDTVRLDFLPYEVTNPQHADRQDETGKAVPGGLWYKAPFRTHRQVGPANETVVCPTTVGKRCPICELRTKMQREGASKEDLQPMNTSRRNLYCVVPLGSKDFEEVPYIWDISAFCFQNELKDELDLNEANWSFPDLEEGLTLSIRFIKKSFAGKDFGFTKRIAFEARDSAYDEAILDDVPKLDELLTILSYDELDRKWMGEDQVEGDTDTVGEEVEQEKAPMKSFRKAKTIVPEPEEEARRPMAEELPFDEDEDEDEPEPPKAEPPKTTVRKRTTAKPAPAEEVNKCPHGHRFGVDTNEKKDCSTCEGPVWEECIDIKEPI